MVDLPFLHKMVQKNDTLIFSLDGSFPILRHEIEARVDGSAFRNASNMPSSISP